LALVFAGAGASMAMTAIVEAEEEAEKRAECLRRQAQPER